MDLCIKSGKDLEVLSGKERVSLGEGPPSSIQSQGHQMADFYRRQQGSTRFSFVLYCVISKQQNRPLKANTLRRPYRNPASDQKLQMPHARGNAQGNAPITPKEKCELNIEQRTLLFRVPFSVGTGMLGAGRRWGSSPRRSLGYITPHLGREGTCGPWQAQDTTLDRLDEESPQKECHRPPSRKGEEHTHCSASRMSTACFIWNHNHRILPSNTCQPQWYWMRCYFIHIQKNVKLWGK